MRSTTIIVVGTLLLGAALLSWWPTQTNRATVEPSPPGQYPLEAVRYEWPTTTQTAPYRPSATTGSNDAAAAVKDAKTACALSPTCPQ